MGTTVERSKKKVHLWKKAIVHFMLCFVMGFFTGFAPTSKKSLLFNSINSISNRTDFSPQPLKKFHQNKLQNSTFTRKKFPASVPEKSNSGDIPTTLTEQKESNLIPKRLVIIVTPTSNKDEIRGIHLRRLANTLKLVAPPLLWVVVEQQSESSEISEILRQTGIMYRHLVFKENFTDIKDEMDHQRNVALNHIEHHRLSGIVHFAGVSNVYDLSFFEEIRAIQVFGTWPMASLSANRNKIKIEGPVCESSEVIGWHLKTMGNPTDYNTTPSIHISSFAFNSSILWDPERWGRTSSAHHTSQDSLKFVKKEVVEEETNLKGIPSQDCSKVLLWTLQIPSYF